MSGVPEADPEPVERSTTSSRDAALFVLAWLPYAFLVQRFWFVTDDAFISFRYARNWAVGHGLRYNLGDHVPVEGFSNFLWVALTALVERLGLDPVACMPALSAIAGSVLLALVYRALRDVVGAPASVRFLATLVLGVTTPFAVWSTGGLETMSFALLLFLAFERAVLRERGAPLASGALALLVALSRPEGIYWALVVGVLGVVSHRPRRAGRAGHTGRDQREGDGGFALAPYFGVLGVGYALFLGWRLATFEHFLPTSATAKLTAGIGLDRLARGAEYVGAQFLTTLSLFALVPAVPIAFRRGRRAVALPVLALALGFPVWALVVSGDFMAFGRFLVPGLPFLALLVGWLLIDLGRAAPVVGGVLAVLGVLPAWNVHPVPGALRAALDFRPHLGAFRTELGYWSQQKTETLRWADRGRALAMISSPGDSIAMSAIGAVGYYSGLFVFDRVGLVTREVAELEPVGDARDYTPGHDDPVPTTWFLEHGYRPTFVKANFQGVDDLQELAQKVAKSLDNLEAVGLARDYFLDVYRVENARREPSEGRLAYLFVWRHPPDGIRTADAARSFEQRMERHLAGGELRTIRLLEQAARRASTRGAHRAVGR